MSMRPVPLPDPDPLVAAAIRRKYAGKRAPLAVTMRDRLGGWMADEVFAGAFGKRGRRGLSPAMLAVVTALQYAEDLGDREAAEAVRTRLDWQYALGVPLDDPGFDFSVLSEFRDRLAEHGLEEAALDALLGRLEAEGLVRPGGKQRADSTHILARARDLHTGELARESVRAALEALAAACPDWVAARLCTSDWAARYGPRPGSWAIPGQRGKAGRRKRDDEAATGHARDGYALVSACYQDTAPPWARELPAVQVLRTVLLQRFMISPGQDGKEAVSMREPGQESGLPPGHLRIETPYDPQARRGVKDDISWLGWKLHVTDTCDGPPACGCPPGPAGRPPRCRCDVLPSIITHVATTDATVADVIMTVPVTAALAAKDTAPGFLYADSGYASAANMLALDRGYGVTLISPLLADNSRQARENAGYDRGAFTIDYDTRTATCPQGHASRTWSETASRAGKPVITVQFPAATCRACPARPHCTTAARHGRTLTLPPRDLHELQAAARARQGTTEWKNDYNRRAGAESTISQALATAGTRRARYHGLGKTRLEHAYTAVAINLIRLDAYWNDTPLDRTRTTNLARLDHALRHAA
jgi:transposase